MTGGGIGRAGVAVAVEPLVFEGPCWSHLARLWGRAGTSSLKRLAASAMLGVEGCLLGYVKLREYVAD